MTIRAGIIGATGYTGIELVRLLQQHPQVTISYVSTESYAGQALAKVYPHLKKIVELTGEKLDLTVAIAQCDVIFIALPHGQAINIVPTLLHAGKKVIDLGADFRLKNPADYQQWYQQTRTDTALLNQAVYGLPEAGYRHAIKNAALLANPGCYPTSAILAALPVLKAKIVDPTACIFDAKSGVSGAGRSLNLRTSYCEIADNLAPYQLAGKHRHTPEIEQALSAIAEVPLTVQFTPHLLPVARGLLTTAYFRLARTISSHELFALYQEAYQSEAFIRLNDPDCVPELKHVQGTNYCDLGLALDTRTQRLVVVSAIDNLLKGASGQAVQNMNLMFGLTETTGLLPMPAIYP